MNLFVPDGLREFETIATIQIAQAIKRRGETVVCSLPGASFDAVWFESANVESQFIENSPASDRIELEYAKALRQQELESTRNYTELLAELSGFKDLKIEAPEFSRLPKNAPTGIIIAPFGFKELEIDVPNWRLVARYLRTYEITVYQMAMGERRIDLAGFAEAEIIIPVPEQLAAVRDCTLIVGIPNAYTWAAARWKKPSIILYPEGIEFEKWYPYLNETDPMRILQYPANDLNVAALLAGLKHLIARLP